VDQPFAEAAPVTSQSVLIYLEGDARGCWIPLYDIYKEMALLACKGETLCKNCQESYKKKDFKIQNATMIITELIPSQLYYLNSAQSGGTFLLTK
jgi:hypothetical protein